MNLGILIILIALLGYISNWLNWRYLNYSVVRLLFYVGAFLHELSHVIFCRLTGATITGGNIFSRKPHVIHSKPAFPLIGQLLISLAPIIGGLLFLFLINKYYLVNYFEIPQFSDWQSVLIAPLNLLSQINLLGWQSWLMILLFLNIGAMIGPSLQDLKNIWPIMIILLFIKCSPLLSLSLLVIILILTNIIIQIILILVIRYLSRREGWKRTNVLRVDTIFFPVSGVQLSPKARLPPRKICSSLGSLPNT